jgi:hypothetical protein
MHTRFIEGLLVTTPNGCLDEATRRLLPGRSDDSWSRVDASQHVLVAYRCEGRVPVGIARLRRRGRKGELTCFARDTAAGTLLIRELKALAQAAGIRELTTLCMSPVLDER